jgi:hypothetical protein
MDTREPFISEKLKLRFHGDHAFISAPSGEKATAKKLEENVYYLDSRMYFYQVIDGITDDGLVLYTDSRGGDGMCSRAHFARKCPTVATKEELDFLNAGTYG